VRARPFDASRSRPRHRGSVGRSLAPADDFPYLLEHVHQHLDGTDDGASEFDFGLTLILDGPKRLR
jgi:hypothetical protein